MIRINLLGGERHKSRKTSAAFDSSRQISIACGAVLVISALGVGLWYWALAQASARVDADIVAAQQEAARLRPLLAEVQQFEARRAQLQQRVALIQQLRGGQSLPVQLLDIISKSIPDMLWLTDVEEAGPKVTIQGLSTTLIAVSDLVGNLGTTPLLKKPIEIVNTEVQTQPGATGQPGVDLIKFTVKAEMAGAEPAGGGTGGAGPQPASAAAPKK
jgi:type IV pilus assembly protein PilN